MRPLRYNDDKPHRCPRCHVVTIPGEVTSPLRFKDARQRLYWRIEDLTDDLKWRHPLHKLTLALRGLLVPSPALRALTLATVTCCNCRAEFTRWPYLPTPKHRGVVCEHHTPKDPTDA